MNIAIAVAGIFVAAFAAWVHGYYRGRVVGWHEGYISREMEVAEEKARQQRGEELRRKCRLADGGDGTCGCSDDVCESFFHDLKI